MPKHPRLLPRVEVLAYTDRPLRGQTNPLFFECFNHDSQLTETYLIKYSSTPDILAREVVGNLLAKFAGLRTPNPAIGFMFEELAREVNLAFQKRGQFRNVQPGHCSACRQFRSGQESALDDIPIKYPRDALRLYIFDMVAGNSDRVRSNPNCTVDSHGLLVFDFEQCFALDERTIMPPGSSPWNVATGGLGRTHMYYPRLKGVPGVRREVRAMLQKLTDERLNRILKEVPRDWTTESRRIINHVKIIKEHAEDFTEDVAESLT